MSSSRSIVASLVLALGLSLALALLPGCARQVAANRPQVEAKQDPVATLQSLHNKIVYVVEESHAESSTYTYSLYWIDPVERVPHLLLTAENPAAESLTTFYLPGRDKMLAHMAPSGNTKTGNDYLAGIDGADPKLLVRGNVTDVFPDGKRLLVASDFSEGGQTYFLYSTDMNGRVLKRLTFRPRGVARKIGDDYLYEGDWRGAVSPDGKSIVYASSWYAQGGGPDDLFRIDSDGSNWKRLTQGRRTGTSFDVDGFSHDGAMLAVTETTGYNAADWSEESFLAFMDLSGHVLRRFSLGDLGGFHFGGWSPDDREVALVSGGYKIDLVTVETGTSTTILSLDEAGNGIITSAVWLE